LITLLIKLAQSSAFLQDVAFATKDPKIYNVGLSTIQELIWCLLFQWVTLQSVDVVASGVDCFVPKRLPHIVSLSIDLAISMSVLFLLSTRPFDYGVYLAEN
jgi:hypothetical protein